MWTYRETDTEGVYAPESSGSTYMEMHAAWLREALPWNVKIWSKGDKRRIYIDIKKGVDAWFEYGPNEFDLETADMPYDGSDSVSSGSRLRCYGERGIRQSRWWFAAIREALTEAQRELPRSVRELEPLGQ